IIGPQVRTSLDNLSKSGSETTGAASANGLEILAGFVDFRTDGTIKNAFSVSSNGGSTWSHLVVRPPAQYQDNLEADPMTAYDPRTNTLFAGGISRAKCIYVAKKLPGQNAFTPSTVAVLSAWPDKGWMAAGPRPGMPNTTRLYVTYNEGIIWSDDLGTNWTPPLSLGTGFGFLPRVGPEGQLYLTYWDGYWGIKFTKSLDGGQTWSPVLQPATRMQSWGVENYGIPGTFRNFTNNTMTVNPANGDIVIFYVDQTNIVNGQKNLDLYMVKSSDQGATWTDAERLPFRPLNQISDMIFPWVEFTKDGRLHLFAMDTALNPDQTDGASHGLWDQTYYYSDNSGVTWSSRFQLTPSAWDSFNEGSGASFLGDYQGMAISDHAVWPVYPDTRTGQAENYVNQISIPDNFILSLNKSSVAGQNSVLGTITMQETKATNTVFTTYDNSSLVTTPSNVTVLAGQLSRSFQIMVTAITSTVVTTVYAKRGALTRSRILTLTPLVPTAMAFTPS
ncbi:MAG: sialidase family protein, partial [Fimbriimonadaceae bacterium]